MLGLHHSAATSAFVSGRSEVLGRKATTSAPRLRPPAERVQAPKSPTEATTTLRAGPRPGLGWKKLRGTAKGRKLAAFPKAKAPSMQLVLGAAQSPRRGFLPIASSAQPAQPRPGQPRPAQPRHLAQPSPAPSPRFKKWFQKKLPKTFAQNVSVKTRYWHPNP